MQSEELKSIMTAANNDYKARKVAKGAKPTAELFFPVDCQALYKLLQKWERTGANDEDLKHEIQLAITAARQAILRVDDPDAQYGKDVLNAQLKIIQKIFL